MSLFFLDRARRGVPWYSGRMPSLRLLLFDIDGTLLRASGAGREAKRRALQQVFGSSDGIESHQFGGKTDWFSLLELLEHKGIPTGEIRARLPSFERVMARHLAQIIAHYEVTPCPGALVLVRRLRQHKDRLPGIVTGNFAATAPVKLRAAGFDPAWFPVGAYGNEALDRNELPPLALERAMAHTGWMITPDQVAVIGDTPADIESARAMGALAVAVETGYTSSDILRAAQPDYLLPNLNAFIERVLRR